MTTRTLEAHIEHVLGLADLQELSGGHQSRVYLANSSGGERVVLKLVERAGLPRAVLDRRVAMLSALGDRTDVVCAPVPVRGQFIHELAHEQVGPRYAVCYQLASGHEPDVGDAGDAATMGHTLAELHARLAELPAFDLPTMGGFRDRAAMSLAEGLGLPQLLHGDFNPANVRVEHDQVRVFDFDDAGYGPVQFDLAHALYVVLFDAVTAGDPDRYDVFKASFLPAYCASALTEYSEAELNPLIDHRVAALDSWLADPSQAPPGIRNSSSAWIATLHGFVSDYRGAPRSD